MTYKAPRVEFVEGRAAQDAETGRPYRVGQAIEEAHRQLPEGGDDDDGEVLGRRYWIRYWAALHGPTEAPPTRQEGA